MLGLAIVGCGGKVVFVESSDDGAAIGGASSDGGAEPNGGGGSPPVAAVCEPLCSVETVCLSVGSEDCLGWCQEKVAIAGECAPLYGAMVECFLAEPENCLGSQKCIDIQAGYEVCVFGCTSDPICQDDGTQTACQQSCLHEFEWTCTQGLPVTCTCAVDGEIVDTCEREYESGNCCDSAFAASH